MSRILFVLLGFFPLVLPGLAIAQAPSDLLSELTKTARIHSEASLEL